MSPTVSFQGVWETLKCYIYDHSSEKLPNFHVITPQIPTCKAPKLFLVWPSIQCHGTSEKEGNVFLESRHFNKESSRTRTRKAPQGQVFGFFALEL